MERKCDECVYHTSGFCSKWTCIGTITVKDVKKTAFAEGYEEALTDFHYNLILNLLRNIGKKKIGTIINATYDELKKKLDVLMGK